MYWNLGELTRPALEAAFPGRRIVLWTKPEEFVSGIGEAELLMVAAPPRGHWAAAKRLRLLQNVGAGIDDMVPLEGLPGGVAVANAAGVGTAAVSEFALMLVLALLKRLPQAVDQQRASTWRTYMPLGFADATLGILGLGRIGRELARKAAALGLEVIGSRRTGGDAPHVSCVYPAADMGDVLARADVTVCLLPLTEQTRGVLDAALLRRAKRGAGFINLGRGPLLDEGALVELLEDGHLSGAALDVFRREPLEADSGLWRAPGLLITPHVAAYYANYVDDLARLFAANAARLAAGQPLDTPVDPARGY